MDDVDIMIGLDVLVVLEVIVEGVVVDVLDVFLAIVVVLLHGLWKVL